MSAVITQALVDLERALRAAPRGQRVEIAQSTAQRLDMSLATLLPQAEGGHRRQQAPQTPE
ncbi:hypothetical protein [Pseudomonas aeruginosa]|uniref:hypothetical protein n=1 Tax=Pseudomonas aeruginosa TaxID=287 RepID=UPI001F5D94F9|nr:hypothetical protein [Pseudomonas aeruginosa]